MSALLLGVSVGGLLGVWWRLVPFVMRRATRSAEPPEADRPPAVHECGPACATWALAELAHQAERGHLAHEHTHLYRKLNVRPAGSWACRCVKRGGA